MINTIIWNFFGNNNNVTEQCNLLHKNNIINIKYSFCIKEYKHSNNNIKHLTFDSLFHWDTIKTQYNYNQEENKLLNNIADKYWAYFSLINHRNIISSKTLDLVGKLDVNYNYHFFRLLISFYYNLIKKNDIKFILFAEFPHIAIDFALYILAKELGIKTLFFYQLILENKFIWGEDVEDISNIAQKNLDLNPDNVEPIKYKVKTPLYMKNIRDICTEGVRKNNITILKFIKVLIALILGKGKLIEYVTKKCSHFYIRKNSYINYLSNRNKLMLHDIDLSQKYVYFPLHLQPELTTITMGGYIYHDQLRAIEDLRSKLPKDIKIYVKENPKQTYVQRSDEFFWRLSMIEGVKLVDIKFDTFKLLQNCLFCASITGTAGFEAIHIGKPALIFGHAFYNNLEGVFKFDNNFDINQIMNYKIDSDKLKNDLNNLNKKLGRGIITLEIYSDIYSKFDKEQNIKNLTENFTKIINHIFKKNA